VSEIDELKARVSRLEQVVSSFPNGSGKAVPAWKRRAGLFAGDEAFAEIIRLGAKARRSDRPQASRPKRKPAAKRTA
jgi:hypothetical protein